MTANPQPKTEVGICPGCGARIRFQNKVQVGEFVICDECGDELEVVYLSPMTIVITSTMMTTTTTTIGTTNCRSHPAAA